MQWWEVQRYIDGIRRRQRPLWECTRWLIWAVGKMLGGLKQADGPQELITFPWEREVVDSEKIMEDNLRLLNQLQEKNKAAQEAANTSGS